MKALRRDSMLEQQQQQHEGGEGAAGSGGGSGSPQRRWDEVEHAPSRWDDLEPSPGPARPHRGQAHGQGHGQGHGDGHGQGQGRGSEPSPQQQPVGEIDLTDEHFATVAKYFDQDDFAEMNNGYGDGYGDAAIAPSPLRPGYGQAHPHDSHGHQPHANAHTQGQGHAQGYGYGHGHSHGQGAPVQVMGHDGTGPIPYLPPNERGGGGRGGRSPRLPAPSLTLSAPASPPPPLVMKSAGLDGVGVGASGFIKPAMSPTNIQQHQGRGHVQATKDGPMLSVPSPLPWTRSPGSRPGPASRGQVASPGTGGVVSMDALLDWAQQLDLERTFDDL
mmetsp:Transcript_39710/g.91367  ORF Transcript_39710/g.91367 Transcript_39710/m.91367 type:complete len:331 (+) Transcript_39710:1-993(+)